MKRNGDGTGRFHAIPPPAPSVLSDQDHAIGRLSAEVSRCTLAINDLKQADDEMHDRMDAVVAYVERSKGRDKIIAALGGLLLTALAGAALMLVRNDEGLRETRGDVIDIRAGAQETTAEIRAARREMNELGRALSTWQATTAEQIRQADERSRRNDEAIRALERGGPPALRRELRSRGQ